ncbi:hypothetical protein BJ944DRAFT_270306 [Cunninghamella echinulata]|nr:hypothetical protein BJ944DRAFT_270306 [Cunninghamella echinulata]
MNGRYYVVFGLILIVTSAIWLGVEVSQCNAANKTMTVGYMRYTYSCDPFDSSNGNLTKMVIKIILLIVGVIALVFGLLNRNRNVATVKNEANGTHVPV